MNMPYARPITGTDNNSNPQQKAFLNDTLKKIDSMPLTAKSSRVSTIQKIHRITKQAIISINTFIPIQSYLFLHPPQNDTSKYPDQHLNKFRCYTPLTHDCPCH